MTKARKQLQRDAFESARMKKKEEEKKNKDKGENIREATATQTDGSEATTAVRLHYGGFLLKRPATFRIKDKESTAALKVLLGKQLVVLSS